MEIIKETSVKAWKAALKSLREKGIKIIDNDNRVTREILNTIITINNPGDDIKEPIKVMKSLKKWIYPSFEELEDVFFKKEASSVYHYTYGARIFDYSHSKNQIEEFIIPLLKEEPNSRRGVVTLYHPLIDSKISSEQSPCLLSIYFKIIEGKLTTTTVIRSNDMFIGWPANIYQVYLLQKYVADQLELPTGNLTTISHSTHIFDEYSKELDEVLKE